MKDNKKVKNKDETQIAKKELAKERNLICLESLKTSYVRAVFISEKEKAENEC